MLPPTCLGYYYNIKIDHVLEYFNMLSLSPDLYKTKQSTQSIVLYHKNGCNPIIPSTKSTVLNYQIIKMGKTIKFPNPKRTLNSDFQ